MYSLFIFKPAVYQSALNPPSPVMLTQQPANPIFSLANCGSQDGLKGCGAVEKKGAFPVPCLRLHYPQPHR